MRDANFRVFAKTFVRVLYMQESAPKCDILTLEQPQSNILLHNVFAKCAIV
jgi:hypothetical protein